ncbi:MULTISPECIES: flagellar FlbD family protein [Paenibacillus]|uniref:Flagellar protein D n=2 Tax=Paenibacillus TaxID=44249 RepID=A0A1V4HSM1_9BACL|nr:MULTISPECIES: flagellar FlbD family protein [Paenibacillus]MEC0231561.1 flagellar FlbD family protein [Paenibacillus alba]NQX65768.1 flagellar FlbD family protein [Paenibacillus alba]OPH61939.1 flagellar protein D [Paenibacillus ferrarius]
MISLTRLNGKPIFLNAILIEQIEETPDTMISLTTGKKITVLEKAEVVVSLVRTYMQEIGSVRATIKSMDAEGS